ncbi:MAG: DUF4097 family beta strand repeat-containing protein [Pseudomonadota bacterium]
MKAHLNFWITLFTSFLPLSLVAGESVNQSLDTKDIEKVEISVVRGEVTVQGNTSSTVQVRGELDDALKTFIFEKRDNRLVIKVELKKNSDRYGKGSKLTISMPEALALAYNGVSTYLKVNNIKNDTKINSVSDQLELENIISPEFKLANVSGNIALKNSKIAHAKISTVSGDGNFELGQWKKLNLSSVSGDVLITGNVSGDESSKISSVSGDIELSLAPESNVKMLLNSGPSGTIDNQLSRDARFTRKTGKSVELVMGEGDAKLKGSTVSGHLKLSRL